MSKCADSSQLTDGSTSTKSMPQLLQSHLYEAFLSGTTYDVLLRVTGSWDAVYKLHRIVLTQAVRAAVDASLETRAHLAVALASNRTSSARSLRLDSKSLPLIPKELKARWSCALITTQM